MKTSTLATELIKELKAEDAATRKCLANIPDDKFEFKPHPSSMSLAYLASLVAEVPLWIQYMIEEGDIDFATFKHKDVSTSKKLNAAYEENITGAIKALENATDEQLQRTFHLKSNGQVLFSEKVADYIGPTINHWIHHRGQLTVYMRIYEIPVPSIYGPSGDQKNF